MKYCVILISLVVSCFGMAQDKKQIAMLKHYEDSLIKLRKQVLAARNNNERINSNELFLSTLKSILSQDISFTYGFDSIPAITNLRSDDNYLRMINWNLPFNDGTHTYYCFIQTKAKKNRRIKLKKMHEYINVELVDESAKIVQPEKKILKPDNWYGALYYAIIPVKNGSKTYYTLLGWDGNDQYSTKKILDVLYFTQGNQLKLGAPIFKYENKTLKRVIFEYSSEATISVHYDKPSGRIIYDHLSPMKDDLKGIRQYYVPDMSFDAFELKKDKWIHVGDIDIRQKVEQEIPLFNIPK